MSSPVVYREVQRFRNLTLWLLVGGVSLLTWYVALRQIVLGQPVGDRPASDEKVIGAWVVFGVALPALFWIVALVTRIDHAGVTIRFWPFPGRRLPWQDIHGAEVITYRPMRDFGGWGPRWAWGRRSAYTVSGRRGVEVTLEGGRRIVIGSAHPNWLRAALSRTTEHNMPASDPL